MKRKQWLSILGLGLMVYLSKPHMVQANPTFGGGSGTENDPYRLSTPEHLTQLQVAVDGGNNFTDKYFVLTNNIDFTGYDNDSNPANGNFDPIGRFSVGYQFSGHLDGKNYTISNLQIHLPNENGVGLFAYVINGEITNLNLESVTIQGLKVVGGLMGHLEDSHVNQISVSGEILGDSQVGGVAGQVFESSVENSHSSVMLTGTNAQVGGLVGTLKTSTLKGSSTSGEVLGGTLVGGLLGQVLESTVENSRSSVTVIGSTTQVGGFVGRLADGSTVRDCQATGSVEGTSFIGGLVGATNLATIEDSSASGDVVGNNSVGGLAGYVVATTIEQSLASGNATGTQKVGGLTGHLETSTIHQSSATGDVEGTLRAGGLSGYATGSEFDYSYSAGSVMGEENIGGFAGDLDDSVITNSYSVGDVTGEVQVGGFAGQFVYANMDNIYVVGNVEGSVDVGGLVGNLYEDARIENAYYVGQVVGDEEVGHLVGWQEDTSVLENVYYDREKNVGLPLIGLNEADEPLIHVVGLTTNQMTQGNVKNYMPTFDFETVWITTSTTPMFRWQTHLVPASQGDVQVSGTIQPLLANVNIPSVSPDLVINPNLPDSVISPEFSIENQTNSPIQLELKTFEQTTSTFNDVLPDKYGSWETLNKKQSQDLALGLAAKEGEGWQCLVTPTSYVANHQAHEIGVVKPKSSVAFEFEVHHGRAFSEAKTIQYRMVFVFDLLK